MGFQQFHFGQLTCFLYKMPVKLLMVILTTKMINHKNTGDKSEELTVKALSVV